MSGIYFVKLLFQLYIRICMYIYICIRFMITYIITTEIRQNNLKTINLEFIDSLIPKPKVSFKDKRGSFS